MNCPKCNHENVNDAKYCTECGTPLFKVCENCGKPTQWTTKFCSECGGKFPVFDLKVEYYKRKLNFYDEILIGKCKDGKFVLVKDRQTYKILNIDSLKPTMPYEFDDVGRFTELDWCNSIIVKKDGLWGLVNPLSGQIICDFKYEDYTLVYFEGSYDINGTVLLKENGKWGKVDVETGQVLLPFIYDAIYEHALDDYHQDFDLLKYNGFWGVLASGEQLIPFEYIKLGYKVYDRWGYLSPQYGLNDDSIPPSQYKNGKWGIIDIYNGNIILEPEYDEIKSFGYDTYKVRKGVKWGVINNHDGKTVLPCEYKLINFFKSGDYKVIQEKKWGIISPNGMTVLKCNYDEIIEWEVDSNQYVYKLRNGDKWGVYSNGNVLLGCEYDEIEHGVFNRIASEFCKGEKIVLRDCFIIKQENKWGICTTKGIVLSCEYDEIEVCGGHCIYYKIRKGQKLGVGSDNGGVLPCEYDEVYFNSYSDDITMRKGDKWGKVIFHYHKFLPTERFDYDCIYSEDEIKKLR